MNDKKMDAGRTEMSGTNIFKAIATHWLREDRGWSIKSDRTCFPYADLIANGTDGETWLIAFADDDVDRLAAVCLALGRLILMMDRECATGAFGLPIPDPAVDPPLLRYAIAVPNNDAWKRQVRAIPERIRRILHLVVLLVSDEDVTKYLPGVPV
jgi:hypothetical protein